LNFQKGYWIVATPLLVCTNGLTPPGKSWQSTGVLLSFFRMRVPFLLKHDNEEGWQMPPRTLYKGGATILLHKNKKGVARNNAQKELCQLHSTHSQDLVGSGTEQAFSIVDKKHMFVRFGPSILESCVLWTTKKCTQANCQPTKKHQTKNIGNAVLISKNCHFHLN
jgi:hypothetical protein